MFYTVFKSAGTQDRAAAVLAALTSSASDQVSAFHGIVNASGTLASGYDWRPSAAASFIKASSFLSSELVDAVLDSQQGNSQVELVCQHQLLDSQDLLRVIDSSSPSVLAAVENQGLLGLLSPQRVDALLRASPDFANVMLRSEFVTVEWLQVVLAGVYAPSRTSIPLSVPVQVADNVFNYLSPETVLQVLAQSPVSFWWVPLLTRYQFSPQVVQQFFDAAFNQLATLLASDDLSHMRIRNTFRVMLAVLDTVASAEKFPALFEPVAAPQADTFVALLEKFLAYSSPAQLQTFPFSELSQHAADAIVVGSPSQQFPPPPSLSRPSARVAWISRLPDDVLVTVWRSNLLSFEDLVLLVHSDLRFSWDTLDTLLDVLSSEPSFIAVLPDLYHALLKQSDTSTVRGALRTTVSVMPFEMQIDTLLLKDLVAYIDVDLLQSWWQDRPQLSFAMLAPLMSTDAPLTILEAVGCPDRLSEFSPNPLSPEQLSPEQLSPEQLSPDQVSPVPDVGVGLGL